MVSGRRARSSHAARPAARRPVRTGRARANLSSATNGNRSWRASGNSVVCPRPRWRQRGAGMGYSVPGLPRGSGGMADAHGSGPCARKGVRVQLPPSPPPTRAPRHAGPSRRIGACRTSRYAPMVSCLPTDQEWRVSVALVTGSGGLIGSEAVRHFAGLGLDVVGIDNDMRPVLLRRRTAPPRGACGGSTDELGDAYTHFASTSGTGTAWSRSSRSTARTSPW